MLETAHCEECSSPFTANGRKRRFCRDRCARAAQNKRTEDVIDVHRRSDIGAASELIASTWLILQGYEVFRALSPATSCDLITLRDGQCVRVEVKTGWRGASGELRYGRPKAGRFDLLVVVMNHDDVVALEPKDCKVVAG